MICHVQNTEGPRGLPTHLSGAGLPVFLYAFLRGCQQLSRFPSHQGSAWTRKINTEEQTSTPWNFFWNLKAKRFQAKNHMSLLLFFSPPWPCVTSLLSYTVTLRFRLTFFKLFFFSLFFCPFRCFSLFSVLNQSLPLGGLFFFWALDHEYTVHAHNIEESMEELKMIQLYKVITPC